MFQKFLLLKIETKINNDKKTIEVLPLFGINSGIMGLYILK